MLIETPPADCILETRRLSKEFKGFAAVSDLNLQVQRGAILAEGTYAEDSQDPQVMDAYMGSSHA